MYKTYTLGEGERSLEVLGVHLDMINMRVFSVHVDDFNAFLQDIDYYETVGVLPTVKRTLGKGYSDYKYKLNFGKGDGAVFIGYEANGVNAKMAQEKFDMKIEYNPQKHDYEKYKMLWVSLSRFKGFKKAVKGFDIAFDIKVRLTDVVPISLTGKQPNRLYGSYYFGQKGSTGFLKIYDKAEEEKRRKKGSEVSSEGSEKVPKTRFEFSIVLEETLNLQLINSLQNLNLNKLYRISSPGLAEMDDELQCYIYAIQTGFKTYADFKSRRKKEKIKKALQDAGTIDFDAIYKEHKALFISQMRKCLNFEWYVFQ